MNLLRRFSAKSLMVSALRLRFPGMHASRQLPFDVDDPKVQRACRAVAWLLMGDAGEQEARRTVLAVLIAATGKGRNDELLAEM